MDGMLFLNQKSNDLEEELAFVTTAQNSLGLIIIIEKLVLTPLQSQSMEFLGVTVNSVDRSFSLP